jgi:hypothetical protein
MCPLEFTLQVAFRSRPAFSQSGEGETATYDKSPWIVANSGEKIEQLLEKRIERDQNARDVLFRMRQFTIVQRLFRSALLGNLGTEFPLEKMVSLAAATTADDYAATPRWSERLPARMVKNRSVLDHIMIGDPMVKNARDEAVPVFDRYLGLLRAPQTEQRTDIQSLGDLSAIQAKVREFAAVTGTDRDAVVTMLSLVSEIETMVRFRELRAALHVDAGSETNLSSSVENAASSPGGR